jgi:biopolymer transport protein ExbD
MPLKTHQEELPAINLTSMIDVVFLLLIFFMVGTKFTDNEQSISINLPNGASSNSMLSQPVEREVIVERDGSIRMNNQLYDIPSLTSELSMAHRDYPDLSVRIVGDKDVPYGKPVEVMTAIQSAGITQIGIGYQKRR